MIKLQCVKYQWIRLNEFYKLMESFFSHFEFVFKLSARNRFFFFQINSEAWILVKLQCVSYISMDSSRRALQTNERLFVNFIFVSKFWQKTENFGLKPKNIQKNSESWILIKLQCVIYQWICLNKLYKLMEKLFKISDFFYEILTENRKNSESWILIKISFRTEEVPETWCCPWGHGKQSCPCSVCAQGSPWPTGALHEVDAPQVLILGGIQGLLYHRTCKPDFLCSWPSLNSYLK